MKTLLHPLLPLIVLSAATLTGCVGDPWSGAMSDERLEAKYNMMKAECHHRIEMEVSTLRTLDPSGVVRSTISTPPRPTRCRSFRLSMTTG